MPSRAVNKPVDPKQRDKDINTKLQLFGMYHAFKNGKLPSNKQADVALNSALAHRSLTNPSKELSEEGRGLVQDLRTVIEEAKKLILSKNDGQLLQEFIYDAQTITADDVHKPGVAGSDSAEQDAAKAREGLKSLGTLMITNGEFRKLLNDAMIIARDIAGDASQKAANKVRPGEHELSQVDQAAEDNVWHEKPDLAGQKEQFKSRFGRNKDKAQQEASDVANTGAQAATGPGGSSLDPYAGVNASVEQAQSKVPEDQQSKATNKSQEYKARTQDYLSRKFPPERRDQAIYRLKKMIIEIQGHRDYQQAIETLLDLAEKYGARSRHMAQQGSSSVQGTRGQGKIQTMEKNLRTLIERFANSTSMDDFFDSLENIYRDADNDPELKGWFKNTNNFLRKTLQQQGFVLQDDWNRQYDDLAEHGRFLLRDRYRDHTNRVLDEVKFLGDQFNQDRQNRAFGDAMQKLFTDLGQDESGKPKFKKHLVKDITEVILPAVFENVRYVPVPRIEVQDAMADVVIENLVVESDNLMPNVVEFGSDNYYRWGRKKISSKRDNKIMISVSGIQADLRDVSFYINKKQGFPSITDTGVMDIFLGGDGISFKIAASTAQNEDRQNFVKVDKVSVKLDDIDIKLKKSKHKILFTLFKPLLFKTVRPALQKAVEKQIRDAFEKADAYAYEVHQEAQRVKGQVKENPEDAPNIYNRYMNALRAKMEEARRKAQEAQQQAAQRDSKVQTTTTMKASLFPDIKLPGGITTKATEYEELSRKGERWESPIFGIGSASESTDIPKPAEITRKPHNTAEGKLRDRQPAGYENGSAAGGLAAAPRGPITDGGALATGRVTDGGPAAAGPTITNGGTGVTNGHAKRHDSMLSSGTDSNGRLPHDITSFSGSGFNPQTA
ncbi:uncharacterized protein DSM5745_01488 [Aspergillus mulundensis]|uniref:Lipid binding protein n=1 Tax=Aspergillus mulundensis TaxID=1810919 RepID=A0A3D8T6H4_9EURO|nr:Uncharacterized protein DSM5745_01488 [Aspergillus mulundensis]RDW94166.1 Uncharacterized protein DSM5745_01488 [Aspergillus mulundensis]